MKKYLLVFSLLLFLSGCGEGDQVDPEASLSEWGESFSNAVVVEAQDSISAVNWEYEWLELHACQANEGYQGPSRQVLEERGGKMYDVITAECKDKEGVDYHFDVSHFYGQN